VRRASTRGAAPRGCGCSGSRATCCDGDALAEEWPRELPADQAALRARVLEERDYAEIAERMRCSQAVVRKRVSRALVRLRRQLSEEST
jgi:hypothetical protein